ncbi:hypothetical protein VTI74DRAFT_10052 [Chaetomium olivicolor]
MTIEEVMSDNTEETTSQPTHSRHHDVDTRRPNETAPGQTDQNKTPPDDNPTLLPAPVANWVSFATRSTGFAIRLSSAVGGKGLDLARITTLTGIELCRVLLQDILSRACKDTVSRVDSEQSRTSPESALEVAIKSLHGVFDQAAFWTATGFQLTSTTLTTVSEASQMLLLTFDKFFGSTDTSRAMAGVMAMIARELRNPATGVQKENTSFAELMVAICALAYLQRSCRGLLREESLNLGVEETVWDMVVLNDGARVDVSTPEDPPNNGAHRLPTPSLERQILRSLPDNAKVSIERDVTTSETIRVKVISDGQQIRVEPPPGVELVEVNGDARQGTQEHDRRTVYSEFVFRQQHRETRTTSFQKVDGNIADVAEFVSESDRESGKDLANDGDGTASDPLSFSDGWTEIGPGSPDDRSSPGVISTMPLVRESSKRFLYDEPVVDKPLPPPPVEPPSDTLNSGQIVPYKTEPQTELVPVARHGEAAGLSTLPKHPEKLGGLRGVLKRSISVFNKDSSSHHAALGKKRHTSSTKAGAETQFGQQSLAAVTSGWLPMAPRSGHRVAPGSIPQELDRRRHSTSRKSYISIHESVRHSSATLAQNFTMVSADECCPDSVSDNVATSNQVLEEGDNGERGYEDLTMKRRRRKSQALSIYTLATARSDETSLAFYQPYHSGSAYSATEALGALRQMGMLDGMFPQRHFLGNVTRYMRFASASYGPNFTQFMGIRTRIPTSKASGDTNYEVRFFAHHSRSDPSSILLASFVDPQGGSDSTGSTNTGLPLVHYISIDHESKAVVLTCRGTLGFEDVLTDMTCEYDTLVWRGMPYKVHKGIHASARRLLYGGDGKVLVILRDALERYPDYGLVLAGHSLGAAVTSVLAIMLAEPGQGPGSPFVTSAEPHRKLLPARSNTTIPTTPVPNHVCLPAGRAVHVYAYGPPSTICPSLRKATLGLITTIVNGNDMVPYLSLGLLHDMQGVALALKTDSLAAKSELTQRALRSVLSDFVVDPFRWSNGGSAGGWYGGSLCETQRDREWAYARLKILRGAMAGEKLVPPGNVFVVESVPVLRREAFLKRDGRDDGHQHLGRPAHRVVLKYVRDVERRFGEVRFAEGLGDLVFDHLPGRYEMALERLEAGLGVSEGM